MNPFAPDPIPLGSPSLVARPPSLVTMAGRQRRRWPVALGCALLCVACGDDEQQLGPRDVDGDGWLAPVDCDDDDPRTYPGADEVPYDGIDQDCSGSDLNDVDHDGFIGGLGEGGAAGAGADGGEDCDDRRADVHPAAVDVCGDGIDQDCSGSDQACSSLDRDGDGVSAEDGDCNDADSEVSPRRRERYYNDVDDDCDPETVDGDQDGDGFSLKGGGDCDDEDASIFPGADEIPYDGIDQDCSGSDLVDVDGDGVAGAEGTDCNDLDPGVSPRVQEVVLDGIDQNCDGNDLVGSDDFVALSSAAAVVAEPPVIAAGHDLDDAGVALAAWTDSRTTTRQAIYGRFVDAQGDPLGDEFEIEAGGLAKSALSVASQGAGFMLAWHTAEGVFVKRIALEGPAGSVLQVAPVGGVNPDLTYGAGNYAVTWLQSSEDPPQIRARRVSAGGLSGDNVLVREAEGVSAPSLAGTESEFFMVWSEAGIHGRRLNGDGEPDGDAFALVNDSRAGSPDLAVVKETLFVSYARSAPFAAWGLAFDRDGTRRGGPLRLSSDTPSPAGRAFVTPLNDGVMAAWSDGRHSISAPGYSAVYGNLLSSDVLSGEASAPANRALLVGYQASQGGVASLGDLALVAVTFTSRAGVLRVETGDL